MKHFLSALFVVISISLRAQPLSQPIADAHVNVASLQLQKAAWCQETSIWWGLVGSAFTVLAADQSAKVYDRNLAIGIGALTVGGFCTLQIMGAKHTKKASVALHQ